jgi:hypothetical protein
VLDEYSVRMFVHFESSIGCVSAKCYKNWELLLEEKEIAQNFM